MRKMFLSLVLFALVLVCTGKYAKRYHSHYYRGINQCGAQIVEMPIEQAKKKGLTPCGYCY